MLVGRFAQPQVSPGVLLSVWGGWMEKTGMGYNGGAAELMQRAELCIGFLWLSPLHCRDAKVTLVWGIWLAPRCFAAPCW